VAEKWERYRSREKHGEGLRSLTNAFAELNMPVHRRPAALEIVSEVLAANSAQDFYWYVPRVTREVCCYWDGAKRNLLWISPTAVWGRPALSRPERALTYSKEDGGVGWLLPGAESGTGSGRPKKAVSSVLCPETGIRRPAGSTCPDCEVVHG
jgi:hypothetical protein